MLHAFSTAISRGHTIISRMLIAVEDGDDGAGEVRCEYGSEAYMKVS
jgi:hypothetical protein